MEVSEKTSNIIELAYNPAIPHLNTNKKSEKSNVKRYMHLNVHNSTIYKSQNMEAT